MPQVTYRQILTRERTGSTIVWGASDELGELPAERDYDVESSDVGSHLSNTSFRVV